MALFRKCRKGRQYEWSSGKLEAGVRVDGVAQLLAESRFARVVGQLEQIEAGGRSGQTRRALLVARRAHVQEALDDGAQRVARVLSASETSEPHHCTSDHWLCPSRSQTTVEYNSTPKRLILVTLTSSNYKYSNYKYSTSISICIKVART